MPRRLREFRSLSRGDQELLCTSVVVQLWCRALLATTTRRRASRVVRSLVAVLPPYAAVGDPDRIAWAVRCADVHLPGTGTCLTKATVGEALLAASGHQATVRLGVAKPDATFRAHAWVERDGRVLIGDLDDLDRYASLADWDVDP